jgi:hypothetical protein
LYFLEKMAATIVCVLKGHTVIKEEIKSALRGDMLIECDRCGMSSPIKIDENKHVRIQATGEPEILFHGSDLGHINNWKP